MLSSVLQVPFKEPAVKAFSLRSKGDIIYNYSHRCTKLSEIAQTGLTPCITIDGQNLIKAFISWLKNATLPMRLVYKELLENRCWSEDFRKDYFIF